MELLIGAAALLGIFGPLSLIAWVIKKAIARRARRRRINQMFMNLPLRQEQPTERPTSPRVLYVPKGLLREDDEVIVPSVFIGWDEGYGMAKPETEVFVGKGGASGGAGASGGWDEEKPETVEQILDSSDRPAEVAVMETSETTIDVPETPSES